MPGKEKVQRSSAHRLLRRGRMGRNARLVSRTKGAGVGDIGPFRGDGPRREGRGFFQGLKVPALPSVALCAPPAMSTIVLDKPHDNTPIPPRTKVQTRKKRAKDIVHKAWTPDWV